MNVIYVAFSVFNGLNIRLNVLITSLGKTRADYFVSFTCCFVVSVGKFWFLFELRISCVI